MGTKPRSLNPFTLLWAILDTQEIIMANLATLTAAFDSMKASMANLAADVQRLKDAIGTGMSQADVDAAQAQADAIATGLQALADATPDA